MKRGRISHLLVIAAYGAWLCATSPQSSAPPTQLLSGIVLDPEGDPVAGVLVFIAPFPDIGPRGFGLPAARTGDDGRFSITLAEAPIPPEIYVLTEEWAPGHACPEDGSSDASVEIRLSLGAVLSGRLTDPSGQPIQDGLVELFWQRHRADGPAYLSMRPAAHTVRSGPDGRFRIERITPGDYAAVFQAEGFALEVALYLRAHGAGEFDLRDKVLSVGNEVGGIVVDVQDRPIADAQVRISRIQGIDEGTRSNARPSLLDTAVTDGHGTFRAGRLGEGMMSVLEVQAAGYVSKTVEWSYAESPTPLRVVLSQTATLRGRMLNADGRPMPSVLIYPNFEPGRSRLGSSSAQTQPIRPQPSGEFEIPGLMPAI